MKLYYVAHCRFPSERAHAIQIAKMAEAIRLSGADVHLVLPRRKNVISRRAREFYGLAIDIPVRYLPVLDCYRWGRVGYAIGGFSFLISYFIFLLSKKIHGEKFALYTIDMDEFSFIGVSFLSAPFVMEIHGAKKYGALLNRMFTRARAILTINNFIKSDLIRNFQIPGERILVHPNGIDANFFSQPTDRKSWRAKWNIPPHASLVLYVGKCYDWKGMEIFKDTARTLPDVTFAFVGCTKEEFERVTSLKIEARNAIFFGERPYIEMSLWMKSADILLVIGTRKNPYSYTQPSPMKLFEYMGSGVPVLAPETPAIRAQVSNKEVFFYEPDDAGSLAKHIKEILNNASHAKTLTENAKEFTKKFSWEHRARMILAEFNF